MDNAAKLIASIAALLSATLWPAIVLVLAIIYRRELLTLLGRLPTVLDRTESFIVAGLKFNLRKTANIEALNAPDHGLPITATQVTVASEIAEASDRIGIFALSRQLDRLCFEYDATRRSSPSSENRTKALTLILIQMRLLAPSLVNTIPIYKSSGSPGSRLAAVAMMQMVPSAADLPWLVQRFSIESPFIFYHAALALQNAASEVTGEAARAVIRSAGLSALEIIKKFSGVPDKQTIEILESLVSSLL